MTNQGHSHTQPGGFNAYRYDHYWNYSEGRGRRMHITRLLDNAEGLDYPVVSYCGEVLIDPLPVGTVRLRDNKLERDYNWHIVCLKCRRAYDACSEDPITS